MPASLADWLSYLESLHPKTISLGLERVSQVRQRLDLQPDFPIIIVGGTNGKGSVCAMLEAILHAAGYRVGCYTSPHLLDYNERVRIGKQQANDAELCASFEAIEQVRGDIPLTYFEFGTLAAMQCFISHEVDVAILEIGLGGRLDAVNVFDPDCSVVTNIGIDHVDYLGNTREQIAFEKAGIFRKSKVAICADNDVPQVLRRYVQQIGAELWCLGNEFSYIPHQGQWDYRSKAGSRNALPIPALRGTFQLDNASAALAALDAMKEMLPVSMEAVRRGLVEVQLAGRFQFMPGQPQLILDVAHNPQAAQVLAQNLADQPPAKTFAVFSMLKDKDIAGVAKALDGQTDVWLVAGIDAPRGATTAALVQVLQNVGVHGEVKACVSITEAMHEATRRLRASGRACRIVACGSFYTVAEVMRVCGLRSN